MEPNTETPADVAAPVEAPDQVAPETEETPA